MGAILGQLLGSQGMPQLGHHGHCSRSFLATALGSSRKWGVCGDPPTRVKEAPGGVFVQGPCSENAFLCVSDQLLDPLQRRQEGSRLHDMHIFTFSVVTLLGRFRDVFWEHEGAGIPNYTNFGPPWPHFRPIPLSSSTSLQHLLACMSLGAPLELLRGFS